MAKRATKTKEVHPLFDAVKFAAMAQKEDGKNISERHCRIINGYIVGFNGIVTAAHPIGEELPHICPNTSQLLKALERITGEHTFTIQGDKIYARGSKFKAFIDCVDPQSVAFVAPDPRQYPLNNAFRDAAELATVFTKEGQDRIVFSSIISGNQTLIGTNGHAFIEAFHGIPFPPDVIIPKAFIDVLVKAGGNIIGFGYNPGNSLTIWYDNNAFIKTQLYVEGWPAPAGVMQHFDVAEKLDIPKGYFEAIETVLPFAQRETKNRFLYTEYNEIRSHPVGVDAGAVVEVKGVPSSVNSAFFGPDVLKMKDVAETMDQTHQNYIFFFGKTSRAIFARAK